MRTINTTFGTFGASVLLLGLKGDSNATEILIDCAESLEEYQGTMAAMSITGPDDTVYPGDISLDENGIVHWVVAARDCGIAGNGSARVDLVDDEGTVVASAEARTIIMKTNMQGVAPDQIANWTEAASVALQEARAALLDLIDTDTTATTNEAARQLAETGRVSAETLRASAETARASAETARATAENTRASAESTRIAAENTRASAESTRIAAENARVSEFSTIEANAQAALSYIGPSEASSTASAAHAAGSYFIYNGKLYQATADIAIGDTITSGTNCAQVPGGAMGEVSNLKSALTFNRDNLNTLYVSNMEQGTITTTGQGVGMPLRYTDSATRIRTAELYDCSVGMSVEMSTNYEIRGYECDINNNFLSVIEWTQSLKVSNASAKKIAFVIRNKTNTSANIIPSEAISAIVYSDFPLISIPTIQTPLDDIEQELQHIEDKTDKIETVLPASYIWQNIQSETGVMYTTGEVNTEEGQRKSISVHPGEKYKVIAYKYGSSYPGYLFFFNGVLVSYVNTQTANAVFTEEITIPDNVDTMVVNGTQKNCDVFKLTLLPVSTLLKGSFAYYYEKQDFTENSGILDRWNNVAAGTGCRCIISVEPGEEYRLFGYKWGSDYAGYYLMNQEGAIMSYDNSTPNGVNRYWDVVVPEGISKLVLNSVSANVGIYKKVYTGAKPYSNWVGKKIAWFGTSIPENSNYIPFGGYPGYVGDLLGATVYNEAVGSSTARRGFRSAISENDPMGVTNMGVAALWSMGATIEEKQELITNWETKWRAVTGYDVAMTDTIRNKALACCYENKLIQKYIIENPVDLYVFDHGYNDYRNNETDLSADPNDFYNRSTFQGAMATFIKAILEANPRANIVLISHYESQRCPGLISMQNGVAEDWNLPFARLDNQLGWAYNRTISVKGHWNSSGYWVEDDETAQTLRLTAVHMLDGKHPNTDRSGKACMQIGAILAEAINKIHPN